MSMNYLRSLKGGESLKIRVMPKASANKVVVEEQADGGYLIRVYVTVVPEDGKANKEVIKLLAKEMKVAKSSLSIVQGLKSRDKVVRIGVG